MQKIRSISLTYLELGLTSMLKNSMFIELIYIKRLATFQIFSYVPLTSTESTIYYETVKCECNLLYTQACYFSFVC